MPRRWRRSPARNDVYRGKPDADSPGVSAGTLGFDAADQWSALRECCRRPMVGATGVRTGGCHIPCGGGFAGRRGRRPLRRETGAGADSPGVSAGTLGFAAADQWSALRECGRGSSSARRRQPLRQLPGGRRQLTPSLAQGRFDRIPRHFCGDRIRAGPEGGPTAWLASPTGGKS